MSLKYKLPGIGWLLLLFLFLFNSSITEAQSGSLEFKNLTVELWPEYDQTEVLVIYRVELDPNTTLPAQLTFHLPDYIESMHAVAYEKDNSLLTVGDESTELRHEDGALLLTFPAISHYVQFEYYDSVILTKQGQARQLDFNFFAPYDIEKITFQVQEPFQAENFSLTPTPNGSFTDGDGLIYNTIDIAGLVSGETFELNATYQRNTDEPSLQFIDPTAGQTVGVLTSSEVSVSERPATGYILVGAGIILLLGVGGYWWWSNKVETLPPEYHRPPPRKAAKTPPSTPDGVPDGFCYKCGTALHPGSNFCHDCGAERR